MNNSVGLFKKPEKAIFRVFSRQVPRSSALGFTMIEILLSLGILAILTTFAAMTYVSANRRAVLDSTSQEIAVYLRFSRQKALSQEEGQGWGVHFDNPSSGDAFWALFIGTVYSSTSSREKITLSRQLKYLTPAAGATVDAIFNPLTGLLSATRTVELTLKNEPSATTFKRTITVNPGGTISVE